MSPRLQNTDSLPHVSAKELEEILDSTPVSFPSGKIPPKIQPQITSDFATLKRMDRLEFENAIPASERGVGVETVNLNQASRLLRKDFRTIAGVIDRWQIEPVSQKGKTKFYSTYRIDRALRLEKAFSDLTRRDRCQKWLAFQLHANLCEFTSEKKASAHADFLNDIVFKRMSGWLFCEIKRFGVWGIEYWI